MKSINIILIIIIITSICVASSTISSLPYTISASDTYILTANLSGTVGIDITANDVILDCQGYSLLGNGGLSNYGILFNRSNNNITIQNCDVFNYTFGLDAQNGSNILIKNNVFRWSNTTDVRFGYISMVDHVNFTNNSVIGSDHGIQTFAINNSLFQNNSVNLHNTGHGTDRGIEIVSNTYNTEFLYNDIYDNTYCIRSDNQNIGNFSFRYNNCHNNTNGLNMQAISGIFYNFTVSNNNFTGNGINGLDITWLGGLTTQAQCDEVTANDNEVSGGQYIYAKNTDVYNSSIDIGGSSFGGVAICGGHDFILANGSLSSIGQRNNNEFINISNATFYNILVSNFSVGFRFFNVQNVHVYNITIIGTSVAGISLGTITNTRNTIENFTMTNLYSGEGIRFGGSNTTIRNGLIENSSNITDAYGFTTTTIGTGNVYENILVRNTNLGLLLTVGTGNNISGSEFYNVTTPVKIASSASGSKTYNLSEMFIGSADNTRSVAFSLLDTVAPNEQYTINLETTPTPPTGNYSLAGETLNFTSINGTMNLTSFAMLFNPIHNPIYDYDTLALYKYNGSWNLLNNTPDLNKSIISYTAPSLSSGSSELYSLLIGGVQNISSCGTISTSNTYLLTTDLTYNGTCINIQTGLSPTKPTIIDCQGHSLVGNETGDAVLVLNSNNVTIQNCNASHNYDNIVVVGSANGIIRNNELFHDNDAGINFWYSQISSNWLVFNNTIHGGTYDYGIACDNLTSSIIDNNYIYDYQGSHGTGRTFSGGYYCSNNIIQNNRFNNASSGVRLNGGIGQEDNNSFINNTITNMSNYGIVVFSGALNTSIVNNTFNSISLAAFIQQPSTPQECNNKVSGNTVNSLPIFYYNDSNLNINGLNAGQFIICNADDSNFTNINIYGNSNVHDEEINIYQSNRISLENIFMLDTHYGLNIQTSSNSLFKNIITRNLNSFSVSAVNTNNNLKFDNISVYNMTGSNLIHMPAFSISSINSTFQNLLVQDCNMVNTSLQSLGYNVRATSSGNTITNASIINCNYGVEIDSGVSNIMNNVYVENMSVDSILVNSTVSGTKTFTLNNVTLANTGGLNLTSFSLDDSVAPLEQYSINLANSYPSTPANEFVFTNSMLNITAINGTMNFTSFNTSYIDSQLLPYYYENGVSLYENNGANWILLNDTPDTTNNAVSYSNLALSSGSSSLYGLLTTLDNVSNTTIIYYTQTPYTNYTTSGNTITVGDTGNYLIDYSSNGGNYSIFIIFFGGAFFLIVIKYIFDSELI